MWQAERDETIAYLSSDDMRRYFQASAYWPKWNGPWWHMLLLHEMGETARIPEAAIETLIEALNATPIKIFLIHPGELPADADAYNHCFCHCQIGNVYRVLDAWGVDVEARLPWISGWFARYQMADGGMNCDNAAYLLADECASSMVGTIAAFEALVYRRRDWTETERHFVDRAAGFMIQRKLTLGSASRHNEAERETARQWTTLCFPRFYHYDVLRGLTALVTYAERTHVKLPREAVAEAMAELERLSADGGLKPGRLCCEDHGTITQRADGTWDHTPHPAARFPLLDAVNKVGVVSPHLTQQWDRVRTRVAAVTT